MRPRHDRQNKPNKPIADLESESQFGSENLAGLSSHEPEARASVQMSKPRPV